ncbi:sodium/calcium exchanger 2, partial [Carlito syrichta]|uniref:Sodium/calcium exchanger 2 n=1 Tax=Carlito syrichta TaxID=1868482 RepID=A0A3Q0DMK7_CARSF
MWDVTSCCYGGVSRGKMLSQTPQAGPCHPHGSPGLGGGRTPPPANDSDASAGGCEGSYRCQPGVLLPVWEPDDPSLGDKAARAVVYFVAMVYMFLGVSIIADRFMAAIEVITSKEKEITITKANGETSVGTVRIWNETVSNLTLMALGSSAPEILLSVIEVCGHNFQAGELGPGTIVGSAAFNMFVVIAVCIYVIPAGESRKIKHLRVFFVTASWSIFAYVWLYLILAVFSPGVVQVSRDPRVSSRCMCGLRIGRSARSHQRGPPGVVVWVPRCTRGLSPRGQALLQGLECRWRTPAWPPEGAASRRLCGGALGTQVYALNPPKSAVGAPCDLCHVGQ